MLSVLELVGVIISIPSCFTFLYAVYRLFCTHWYALQHFQKSLENATTTFNRLLVELTDWSRDLLSCRQTLLHSAYTIESLPDFNVSRIHSFVNTSIADLQDAQAKDLSRNIFLRFLHSKSINHQCLQREELAKRLIDHVQRMKACSAIIACNAHHIPTAQRFMDDLSTTRHCCDYMIQTYENNTGRPDPSTAELPHPPLLRFKPAVHTPNPPSYVILDHIWGTPEGELQNRILSVGDEISGLFKSSKVVLVGRKGSGKTCIMNSVPTSQAIQDKFTGPGKGGIYSITVGHSPDLADIKRQMSEIVEVSGAWHLRERILRENVSTGILIMAEWFMNKPTLFLVDEIGNSPLAKALEDQLETLSRTSESSVVVFSTRMARNSGDDVVHIPSGDNFAAEKWLLRLSEINPERGMKKKTRKSIDKIVSLCNREKRLLGQVSVCYRCIRRTHKYEAGWERLAGRLSFFMRAERNVKVALTALLLDLMKPQIDSAFPGTQSVQRLYQALQVVRVEEWIPLHELRKKWKLGEAEYETVKSILVDGRLCQVTERRIGNGMIEGMETDGFWWDSMRKACMLEEVTSAA